MANEENKIEPLEADDKGTDTPVDATTPDAPKEGE